MIAFPDNPTSGQLHLSDTGYWRWNGVAWCRPRPSVVANIDAADSGDSSSNSTAVALSLTKSGSKETAISIGETAAELVLGIPQSGNLINCTVDGTLEIGYRNIPQNVQSANYTLKLEDAGKHILHPASDSNLRTFTIPANASVAFPIGTAITFVNQSQTTSTTIAITSDVMRLAGAGTTGARSLGTTAMATAIKITATEWFISGTGLS